MENHSNKQVKSHLENYLESLDSVNRFGEYLAIILFENGIIPAKHKFVKINHCTYEKIRVTLEIVEPKYTEDGVLCSNIISYTFDRESILKFFNAWWWKLSSEKVNKAALEFCETWRKNNLEHQTWIYKSRINTRNKFIESSIKTIETYKQDNEDDQNKLEEILSLIEKTEPVYEEPKVEVAPVAETAPVVKEEAEEDSSKSSYKKCVETNIYLKSNLGTYQVVMRFESKQFVFGTVSCLEIARKIRDTAMILRVRSSKDFYDYFNQIVKNRNKFSRLSLDTTKQEVKDFINSLITYEK